MSILDGVADPVPYRSAGVTLQLRRLGAGPRLVVLHGGPGLDHHVMLPLAIPLSRRFEVWLPDLPGHGRSHPDDVGLPDLTTVLERATRWLAGLDPPLPVLMGHSLGAWLAREMVADGGIRPRALVLISSPVPVGDQRAGAAPRSWMRERGSKMRERGNNLAREFIDLCAADTDEAPSAPFVEAVNRARLRWPGRYQALQGQLRRALCGRLRRVDAGCPVLVLTGDSDPVCPPDEAARLGAATPGSVVRVIERAGHVPYATDAEPMTRAILEFVDASVAGT